MDENPHNGNISLGLSVIVRVTLRDGTFHEDVGYGQAKNVKDKASAFDKAKKEGTTDGLKRALRNFGNVLGNCTYDKDYISKVTKLKVVPVCGVLQSWIVLGTNDNSRNGIPTTFTVTLTLYLSKKNRWWIPHIINQNLACQREIMLWT